MRANIVLACIFPAMVLSGAGCASMGPPDDLWFARDKAYHFGVCTLASCATAAGAHHNGASSGGSFGAAMGVTVVLGSGKESYDKWGKGEYWSWKDFCWDILGGLAGFGMARAIE